MGIFSSWYRPIGQNARSQGAGLIMLDEAMGAVRKQALCHSIGNALMRRFGGEDASEMADMIVAAVQMARRKQ